MQNGNSANGAPSLRALLISFYFPPAGGGGVQRPLKLAAQLPKLGVEMHVLAPDDPRWLHRDELLAIPAAASVHRARYIGPRGRLPAEELYGRHGLDRLARRIALTPRRLVLPDENVSWAATAIPEAIRLVRRHGIDVVITTSPPNSIHLIGRAVKRATGVRWVADLRDSLVSKSDRHVERVSVRLKERSQTLIARSVANGADAVVGATPSIARELQALNPALPTWTVANGADFDDFEGLDYRPSARFHITHTGSFFGKRDTRPFLRALAASDEAVVGRFVGDFRRADREWAESLGLGDRLEILPFQPRAQTLEHQRSADALLLLLPELGERGRDVPSGKLFEYLAARRPILAIVPPDGAAAELVRRTGAGIVAAPDDERAIREAISRLVERWRAGTLADTALEPALRASIDRTTGSAAYAELLLGLGRAPAT